MGGSYYQIPCLIISTGKDRKTPQRYPDVPTTSWRIFIRSMDSFQGLTLKSPSSWHRPLASRLCINIIPLYLFKNLNIGLLEETDHIFGLADGTKSYPVGILKDVKVHIEKLKLLNEFYVIDMKKDPETPLLVGRGFLATANAVIDCRMAKIAVGEDITRESYKPRPSSDGIGAQTPCYARKDFLDCHFPGEWEISRDAEINPFKDTLVFRRMVIFDEKKLGSS
ncbi:agenet domain-containing protein [Tanacetum coccineum]|uniref:Agenet domain-containing protein n=1 Tax=Tanacetum coccineum TaxID=301880 RepID=A0ABQ5GWP6_9ASTR